MSIYLYYIKFKSIVQINYYSNITSASRAVLFLFKPFFYAFIMEVVQTTTF